MNSASETNISQNFQLQLSEIEMISSMYPDPNEFSVTLPHVLADMDRYISGKTQRIPEELDFTWYLELKEHNVKLELNVCLPHNYPSQKPQLSARSNDLNRPQQRKLNSDILDYTENLPSGELCVISVMNWLTENASDYFSPQSLNFQTDVSDCTPNKVDVFCRMWIYSHHIYNKFKRRDIVDSAQHLKLTGFSLPGKPGFICIEGTKRDCDDFLQELKQMSWKKLSLVKEEVQELSECENLDSLRKFESFEEISFQVRRGPAKEYHMNMGQFLKYLESHDSAYVFHDLFGLEGHVSGVQ